MSRPDSSASLSELVDHEHRRDLAERRSSLIGGCAASTLLGILIAPMFGLSIVYADTATVCFLGGLFVIPILLLLDTIVSHLRSTPQEVPVRVSSAVGVGGATIDRRISIGRTEWTETRRLPVGDGALATVARHRLEDERIESGLRAGRLHEWKPERSDAEQRELVELLRVDACPLLEG